MQLSGFHESEPYQQHLTIMILLRIKTLQIFASKILLSSKITSFESTVLTVTVKLLPPLELDNDGNWSAKCILDIQSFQIFENCYHQKFLSEISSPTFDEFETSKKIFAISSAFLKNLSASSKISCNTSCIFFILSKF